APVATYPHEQGCSVTGGFMYRGEGNPSLQGIYFYGDYCSGTVWAMQPGDNGAWNSTVVLESDHRISSFAEDHTGEVYMTDIGSGTLYKLVATGS
ncbi:MAG TPA: glucose dehydrogenase, partial [Roseiflexaceae bacterium]|nr:glucose dehydrogenase [Roseiflexaceae bacterium]